MLPQILKGCKAISVVNKLTATSLIQQSQYTTSARGIPCPTKNPKKSAHLALSSRGFPNYREIHVNSEHHGASTGWQGKLDSDTKEKYTDTSNDELGQKKQAYEKEFADFVANLPPETFAKFGDKFGHLLERFTKKEQRLAKKEVKKLKESLGRPKKVPPPMILFFKDVTQSQKVLASESAAQWKALPEAEKEKYFQRYRKLSDEYDLAMKAYRERIALDGELQETLRVMQSNCAKLKGLTLPSRTK